MQIIKLAPLLLALLPSLARCQPPPEAIPVPVVRVVDGDTFYGQAGAFTIKFRLATIDTPERGEPGYDEATAWLEAHIGDTVWVHTHGTGSFNRPLVDCYNWAGQHLNCALLELGLAAVYRPS